MQKTFTDAPSRTNMISRALNRPATGGDVTFEMIEDAIDNNPNKLSIMEQIQRMQWVVVEAMKELGPEASPEEYEAIMNRALQKNGIVNMRAVVTLEYDEL